MDTREIFDAAPLSVSQFLSETGQGLYIPPYQRQYNWDATTVNRLLSDVVHGLNKILDAEDSICFLGTIISLRDLNYSTVHPLHRAQVPPKVMTIIDGQQRLTSILLLVTILHEELRTRAAKIGHKEDVAEWCFNQALEVTGSLADCYEEDMRYGAYRYYPRLIRAYHDVWSRNDGEARYRSPIGFYLHNYGEYARSEKSNKLYSHVEISDDVAEGIDPQMYRHLNGVRDKMRRSLRGFLQEKSNEETRLLLGSQIGSSKKLQEALFNSEFPDYVRQSLNEESDARISQMIRILSLANYLLKRVTVAVVTAKREDYGFDMFESLNTTGQPLTALETFKPKAIEAEELDTWKESESKKYFDVLEEHIDRNAKSNPEQRRSVTNSLLISFRLLEDGRKLSKRLNEQRNYLRTSFEKLPGKSEKRMLLSALARVAEFYDGPWVKAEDVPACSDDALHRQAGFALRVLHAGKHEIVVAPLTRYYAAYLAAVGEEDQEYRAKEFLLAARACVAFYGIWRGAFGGTNNIDGVYRSLMSHPTPEGESSFARSRSGLDSAPPVERMQEFLREKLREENLHEKELWVAKAAATPVYKNKQVAKLLLLAASNNSVPDLQAPGLIVRARNGVLDLLDPKCWDDNTFQTIEHVAPQSPSANDGWDPDIYKDPDVINRIGNLTLLPVVQNSTASNHSQHVKRTIYKALSSTTVDEAEKMLDTASKRGIDLGRSAQKVVHEAQYLPLVAALAQHEGPWSNDFIHKRSGRLHSLAWNTLAPWLGLEG